MLVQCWQRGIEMPALARIYSLHSLQRITTHLWNAHRHRIETNSHQKKQVNFEYLNGGLQQIGIDRPPPTHTHYAAVKSLVQFGKKSVTSHHSTCSLISQNALDMTWNEDSIKRSSSLHSRCSLANQTALESTCNQESLAHTNIFSFQPGPWSDHFQDLGLKLPPCNCGYQFQTTIYYCFPGW